MDHELKFSVGQKVRVIGNRFDHSATIGDIHTIETAVKELREGGIVWSFQEYRLDGDLSRPWVTEEDIELVEG